MVRRPRRAVTNHSYNATVSILRDVAGAPPQDDTVEESLSSGQQKCALPPGALLLLVSLPFLFIHFLFMQRDHSPEHPGIPFQAYIPILLQHAGRIY